MTRKLDPTSKLLMAATITGGIVSQEISQAQADMGAGQQQNSALVQPDIAPDATVVPTITTQQPVEPAVPVGGMTGGFAAGAGLIRWAHRRARRQSEESSQGR